MTGQAHRAGIKAENPHLGEAKVNEAAHKREQSRKAAQRVVNKSMEFNVCAHGDSENATPLLTMPITLFEPSDTHAAVSFYCQLNTNPQNRAFKKLFQEQHGEDKFPKSTFSVKLEEGRWVHKPKQKTRCKLSDYYSFHLVD